MNELRDLIMVLAACLMIYAVLFYVVFVAMDKGII